MQTCNHCRQQHSARAIICYGCGAWLEAYHAFWGTRDVGKQTETLSEAGRMELMARQGSCVLHCVGVRCANEPRVVPGYDALPVWDGEKIIGHTTGASRDEKGRIIISFKLDAEPAANESVQGQ